MEEFVFEIILIVIFIPFSLALLGLVYNYLYLRYLYLSDQDLSEEDRDPQLSLRGEVVFISDLQEHLKGKYVQKLRGLKLCFKVLGVCALALVVYGVVQQL